MLKTKIVFGLASVVAVLAFTSAPALARWTNHGGKGTGTAGKGVFTYAKGDTVECASASGTYKVNSEGTVVDLEGITWKECKSSVGTTTVTCPSLQLEQASKEGEVRGVALGTVIGKCEIKALTCTIIVETEGNNKGLKSITLEKVGTEQLDKVNASGITGTASSGCLGFPSKSTEGTEVVESLKLAGIGLE